jgi:hypothetical protein
MLGWGQRPGVAARPRGPIPSRSRITPVTSSRRNGQLRIGGAPMHAVGPLQGKSPIEPQTSEIQTPSAIAAPNESAPKTTIAGRTLVEVLYPKYRVGKPSIAASHGPETGVLGGRPQLAVRVAPWLADSGIPPEKCGPRPSRTLQTLVGGPAPRPTAGARGLGGGRSEDLADSPRGRAPILNGTDGPAPRGPPEFDPFTIALLCANPAAPNLDEATRNALQDVQMDLLARMKEAGGPLAAGPALREPNRPIRGVSIHPLDPERVRELYERDPAGRAGRNAIQTLTWLVPKGAFSFPPTRFPHSHGDV